MKTLFAFAFLFVGWVIGYFSGTTKEMRCARSLIAAASVADGPETGDLLRHSTIGGIYMIRIDTNHVEVWGTKGSRQWWP